MNSQISRLFYSFILLLFASHALADFADIQRIYKKAPNLYHLEICQSGGCALVTPLALDHSDWIPIDALFLVPALTADEERIKLAEAIGLLEDIVGRKIGTHTDRAGTFGNSNYPGQLDCNDEAINTVTYFRMLEHAGYIEHHVIEDIRTRNFFLDGWPHTTAVILDLDTGQRYAIDSWFYDNGHPATIVPFHVWEDNYFPEDSPIILRKKSH